MQRPFPNGHKCRSGVTCNGYVTAVAVVQRPKATALFRCQNFYFLPGFYLSSIDIGIIYLVIFCEGPKSILGHWFMSVALIQVTPLGILYIFL